MPVSVDEVRRQLRESAQVKEAFSPALIERVVLFAQKSAAAIQNGGKVAFFGNGGSAADSLHLAAELVVKLRNNRPGLAALSLTTNPSILTATGNDFGFEHIFARQIESLVSRQDVLVALSTSGNSPNVIKGVEAGRKQRAYIVAFTGKTGGSLANRVDLLLNIPSEDPQRIQEAHITVGHIACSMIEELVGRL